MNPVQPTYKPYGNSSILVEWSSKIESGILVDVLAFKRALATENLGKVKTVNHAYQSLLITYKHPIENFLFAFAELDAIYQNRSASEKGKRTTWEIPVCYDIEFACDLELISIESCLSTLEIINIHHGTTYLVYFIGFLPGFLYLGGLDKRLFFPRKATPRQRIPKGAVAIGGEQTGIYPNESPGGWNIIGNTPLSFFEAAKNPPCFAQAGDSLRFIPIGKEEHQSISQRITAGTYELKKIENND